MDKRRFTDRLQKNFIPQAIYEQNAFHCSSADIIPYKGLLWIEDVSFIEKITFHNSSGDKIPSTVFLWIEYLPKVFFRQMTFYRFFMENYIS